MREENTFENEKVAKEWINVIETIDKDPNNARTAEVYPFLEKWVQEVKPKTVVEIGSGQGVCSDKLGDFKGKYIGIEPSKVLLQRARELYSDKPNREFIKGNAYDIPLGGQVAEAVFSVCVWFHIENLHKAAQEMARILRDGGSFAIITGHPDSYHIWRTFFREFKEEGNKLVGTIDLQGGSIYDIMYLHTREDLKNSLESSGLVVDSEMDMGYAETNDDQGIFILIQGHKNKLIE